MNYNLPKYQLNALVLYLSFGGIAFVIIFLSNVGPLYFEKSV